MYSKIFAAAALLTAPLVKATGSAIVDNQCTFPVYLWSVSSSSGPMVSVPSGTNYTEPYRTNSNGGGISIKIAAQKDFNDGITQFEYTLTDSIWYDISNIDGYPFENWGVTLIPSVKTCTTKLCAAGITLCADAYNVPDDNHATAMCAASADLVLVLCSGQTGNVPVSSISTIAAATSTVAKTSTVASTSSSTVRQTSTTTKTIGTTYITSINQPSSTTMVTSTKSSSKSTPVVTSSASVASSTESSNPNEVVITTYVTSWTTVDGGEPTGSTETTAEATRTRNRGGRHTFGARSEERRHVHRHAHDIVA